MRIAIRTGLALLVLAPALGCGATAPFTSRRVSYGTYELTCKLPLPQCLDHVEQICGGCAYEVVTAHDRRVKRTDHGIENDTQASDATVRCELTKPLFGGDPEPPSSPQGAPVAQPAAGSPPAARACVPGATQACVGRAACSGGQACLTDGSRFGPCDCGPAGHTADGGAD